MTNKNVSGSDLVSLYYDVIENFISVPTSRLHRLYNHDGLLSGFEEQEKAEINSKIKDLSVMIKIRYAVRMFLMCDGNQSDAELSAMTGVANGLDKFVPSMSSSSIQRYLTDPRISKIFGADIFDRIQELRKANLLKAKQKGGVAYAKKNTAIQDDKGSFIGSKKGGTKEHADLGTMLEKEAYLFLGGMSINEIAAKLSKDFNRDVSYFDVRNGLVVKLRRFNEELHKKVTEHFTESELEMQEKNKRVILDMYKLYIEEGLTIDKIAEKYGINPSNVSRRLESGLKSLLILFPSEVTTEMVEEVKKRKALNESEHDAEKRHEIIKEMVKAKLSEPTEVPKIDELTDDIESLFDDEESGMGHR